MDKVLIIVGEATETVDTLYPYYRLREAGFRKEKSRPSAKRASESGYRPAWDTGVFLNGKAMLRAGDVLFIAGTPNEYPSDDIFRAVEGRAGGMLVTASATNGQTLETYHLESPPVWGGTAAANNRLFISLTSGYVQCWPGRQEYR